MALGAWRKAMKKPDLSVLGTQQSFWLWVANVGFEHEHASLRVRAFSLDGLSPAYRPHQSLPIAQRSPTRYNRKQTRLVYPMAYQPSYLTR
jgi:hypothetical protein